MTSIALRFEVEGPRGYERQVEFQMGTVVLQDLDLWHQPQPGAAVLWGEGVFGTSDLEEERSFKAILYAEAGKDDDLVIERRSDSNFRWYHCLATHDHRSCQYRVPMYDCNHPAGDRSSTTVALKDGFLEFELLRLNQQDAPLTRLLSVSGSVHDVDLSTDDYFRLLYTLNHPLGWIESYAVIAPDGASFEALVVEGINTVDGNVDEPVRVATVDADFNPIEVLEVTDIELR